MGLLLWAVGCERGRGCLRRQYDERENRISTGSREFLREGALALRIEPAHPDVVKIVNRGVGAILQSPAHALLSGSVDLVRYEGRRSGRTITTPTQYARMGEDVVILVGHPEKKTWWRNFETDGAVPLLVRGAWLSLRARVVRGSDEPDVARPTGR